ncbi:MAG: hypothetical protein IPG01_03260 [Chitinophagaceae bacterium]|nr:hypothetical protein [Chitinophagaceae bacterium]
MNLSLAYLLYDNPSKDLSEKDYYPGGMVMPGRNYNIISYRFGYQNQETDSEIYGAANSYAFKYRMSDPRLIRFWSVDPLSAKYPWLSPYSFSSNRLIDRNELEGLETGPTLSEVILMSKASGLTLTQASDILYGQNDAAQQVNQLTIELLVGISPLGWIQDVYDFQDAYRSDDQIGMFLAGVGFFPFGDFLKAPGKIKKITSTLANTDYLKAGKYGPYKRGSQVIEFTTETEEQFVRLFSDTEGGSASGKWLAKKSDLLDADGNMLSPEKIKDKLALEHIPNKIVDVQVPSGTPMRTGIAGEKANWGSKGGGTQYELIEEIPISSFGKPKDLK